MPTSKKRAASPLVTAGWLRDHLDDPDLRVVDVRWSLEPPKGSRRYAQGHIPGAVFLDLDQDLSAPAGPGRHPIPSAEQFSRAMQKAGIGERTRVIAYDDARGSIAARLWWLAGYFGHPRQVRVLEGGLQAWQALGGPLTRDVPSPPAVRRYPTRPLRRRVVDKHQVAEALRIGRAAVLDARARVRFEGKSEPIDARPGHIPGAVSAFWADNLHDDRFLPAPALRERFESLGVSRDRPVIVYCGSGVTACHDLLALELAGFDRRKLALYEGSWSDWAKDTGRPAATGPA